MPERYKKVKLLSLSTPSRKLFYTCWEHDPRLAFSHRSHSNLFSDPGYIEINTKMSWNEKSNGKKHRSKSHRNMILMLDFRPTSVSIFHCCHTFLPSQSHQTSHCERPEMPPHFLLFENVLSGRIRLLVGEPGQILISMFSRRCLNVCAEVTVFAL